MESILLTTTSDGLNAMWDSIFNSAFQGNYIFWGILLLLAFTYLAISSRMRSGSVIVTGIGLIYFLSLFNEAFKFIFYLAIIVSVIVFVMGVKSKTR